MKPVVDLLTFKIDYTQQLLTFGLILSRTMPMVIQTPFLGAQPAPPEVKMGLGVVFSVLVWPLVTTSLTGPIPTNAIGYVFLMMKEVFIGFCIGFVNSHIYTAVETAGRMIDTARGTAMAEVMVPHSKGRVTMAGALYYNLMVVFFFAIGGHHVFLESFFFSFGELPVDGGIAIAGGFNPFVEYSVRLCGQILYVATILSAPAIAATFITDVVFGILNRVAPQLNAYFMAMPIKAMAGIAMVLVIMEAFLERMTYFVGWSLEAVQKTLELLKPG